jgi:hypothetical protein
MIYYVCKIFERELFKMIDFISAFKVAYLEHMKQYQDQLTPYENLIFDGKITDKAIKYYDQGKNLIESIEESKPYWTPDQLRKQYLI